MSELMYTDLEMVETEEEAFSRGHEEGYNDGHNTGYDEGYSDGEEYGRSQWREEMDLDSGDWDDINEEYARDYPDEWVSDSVIPNLDKLDSEDLEKLALAVLRHLEEQ